MEDWLVFIAIVAAIFLVVALSEYLYRKKDRKKAREPLEAIANSMGLSFYEEATLRSEVVSAKFYLFSRGSSGLWNLMKGNLNNINISLFQFSYTERGAEFSNTQTVALFTSESINLPNFDLRPESAFDRIASVFGYQDIDFESHPQFSRSYLLRGKHENAIRRIFTDDVLSFFSNNTGLSVEARGNKLIYYRHDKQVDPRDMPSFLHEAKNVFDLFKRSQDR